jgi:hypothetical protein
MKIPVGFEEGTFTLEVNYVPLKLLKNINTYIEIKQLNSFGDRKSSQATVYLIVAFFLLIQGIYIQYMSAQKFRENQNNLIVLSSILD